MADMGDVKGTEMTDEGSFPPIEVARASYRTGYPVEQKKTMGRANYADLKRGYFDPGAPPGGKGA